MFLHWDFLKVRFQKYAKLLMDDAILVEEIEGFYLKASPHLLTAAAVEKYGIELQAYTGRYHSNDVSKVYAANVREQILSRKMPLRASTGSTFASSIELIVYAAG